MSDVAMSNGAADAGATLEPDTRVVGVKDTDIHERAVTVRAAAGRRDIPRVIPTRVTVNRVWLIVVSAFTVVLVGSFLTLAVSALRGQSEAAANQLMLTLFMSVVSFLGGLFTPSPDREGRSDPG